MTSDLKAKIAFALEEGEVDSSYYNGQVNSSITAGRAAFEEYVALMEGEVKRLQFALTEIGKGYDYLHKYNAPDHKKYTDEKLFGQQWSNYEGFANFISRVATAALAPDSEVGK